MALLALACGGTAGEDGSGDDDGDGGTHTPACGDGIVDAGEECDLGFANADEGECTSSCAFQRCGDGFVGADEYCDDGNLDDGDACPSTCKRALGLVWENEDTDGFVGDIVVEPSGDILVVGFTYTPDWQDSTAWIRRLDPDGAELMHFEYRGETDAGARALAVASAPDGGFVVAGAVRQSDGSFDDGWISLFTRAGELMWTDTRDADALNDTAAGVVVDDSGNIFSAESSQIGGTTRVDAIVRKLDPMGVEQWAHVFNGDAGRIDVAAGVQLLDGGDLVVSGSTGIDADEPIDAAAWLRRLDALGNEVWTVTEPGPVGGDNLAGAVVVDGDGHLVVAGHFVAERPEPTMQVTWEYAIWTAMYGADGSQAWSDLYDPGTPWRRTASDVVVRGGDEIVVVGTDEKQTPGCEAVMCDGRLWIRAYAHDGGVGWQFADDLEAATSGAAIAVDGDGFLLVGGSATLELSAPRAFVRKYEVLSEG